VIITKRFRFEAAHHLPYHSGKCANLHGHSYVLEVSCKGDATPVREGDSNSGFVIDFAEVSNIVKSLIIVPLDHTYLNDLIEYSSAERIVEWIGRRLLHSGSDVADKLHALRLYETADCWVDWHADDYRGF
jgi:6-pyruvoyltetrahydropterin/6-carboxytetrahydropterin synthase